MGAFPQGVVKAWALLFLGETTRRQRLYGASWSSLHDTHTLQVGTRVRVKHTACACTPACALPAHQWSPHQCSTTALAPVPVCCYIGSRANRSTPFRLEGGASARRPRAPAKRYLLSPTSLPSTPPPRGSGCASWWWPRPPCTHSITRPRVGAVGCERFGPPSSRPRALSPLRSPHPARRSLCDALV